MGVNLMPIKLLTHVKFCHQDNELTVIFRKKADDIIYPIIAAKRMNSDKEN